MRRRKFALQYGIQKLEYATTSNPFTGRVICGSCGQIFGRKVWNFTDDQLRRIIWRCNGKYPAMGGKGCDSKHINDAVLYQVFINTFNTLIENRDYFIAKWKVGLNSDNALQRYKSRQFLKIISESEPITEFKMDLHNALVEKMTVVEGRQTIVTLLDGTGLQCEIE